MEAGKIKKSLFVQFLLFLLSLLLSMTMALIWSQGSARRLARKNAEQLNANSMQQLADKMDEMLVSVQNLISSVAYSPVTYDYYRQEDKRPLLREDLRDVLVNAMITDDEISGIELYDDRGILFMREGRKHRTDIEPTDINTIQYSDKILSDGSGRSYYAVYFPIYDLKNVEYFSKFGVCVFYMSADRIARFLEETEMTEGTILYVADGEWNLLAQNEEGRTNAQFPENWDRVRDRYQASEIKLSKNEWRILSYAPVKGFLEGVEQQTRGMVILYFIFAGILGIMALFCHRAVLEPIHRIAVFVKYSSRQPQERMHGCRQENEIGVLVGNLNRMLDERAAMEETVQQSQKRIYEEQLARKQMEILAYRNQINPHFLYNTLECIRAMAVYQGCEEVGDVTVSLSNMLRYAVKGKHMAQIGEELEYAREYGRIIECRFSKIRILTEPCEELAHYPMVRLTLQPLVENAVLHGLEPSLRGGWVKISVGWEDAEKKENGRIVLRVEDNGCGMDAQRQRQVLDRMQNETIGGEDDGHSIGLVNIYQRLKITYGSRMDFTLSGSIGEGTSVEIRFPVKEVGKA
ncbi:MAG: sensor histidine kinase [Eubacteriales bacterium]|nr:sensor histidine kinase [Eubacteriales bacterium]